MDKESATFLYDVCVVGGCGHVGLPFALVLADSGLKIAVQDLDEAKVQQVMSGHMPFMENGAQEILERVIGNNLWAKNDPSQISNSRYVVVVIGTPVDRHLNPNFADINDFFNTISPYLVDNQHIILRSTVYPGTTEKVKSILDSAGKRLSITFCPERIAQGKAIEELKVLPQIVSGFDDRSIREASELFSRINDDIVVLTPIEAELAKLFTNSWRYIQFATANQFFMIASQYNLDFYRIFDAMRYNYPRTAGFPGAGFAAGPCLLKDTLQLAAFNKNNFFLGHAAMLVNEGLPSFIVEELKKTHGSLSDKVIGILGMAFKANNDDFRESLAYKLRKILGVEAKEVLCTDPFIKDDSFHTLDETIKRSDIVILASPHDEYRDIDFAGKLIVDVWNYYGQGITL
ncbi:MAG: nucleotide sugar dehydrogenase [Candidatus Aquicultor secundus]|uniref:Nucleotide sugar dehydrogenase n=1 Tax=Candidatus Aquicultor secundus TaxID=1973895 RepID=A0A2M7T661_9ACTN|nr:nucleotide sugar dehydrogenase [Candidatus Aquicultor secundus]PIU27834.1 MAG: nucleotide sugar dehydrogenase [Candidatus Aquicultor secundus]PIW22573.1 MAG: nucleotide sugar dehydrogenase [Candidatus Aquicultor secundus]PIZ36249.1 MAG: nucleotide sugar dehydrogenase [Candidatus Aquicultor secundus]